MKTRPFKYNLLIIEDNPADMRLTREAALHSELGEDGEISCALSADRGIELLEESHKTTKFHAVILDLNMPRKGGKEVLSLIKQDKRNVRMPVFILTNSDYEVDISDCFRKGADGYFQKPTDFDQLTHLFSSIARSFDQYQRVCPAEVRKRYNEFQIHGTV